MAAPGARGGAGKRSSAKEAIAATGRPPQAHRRWPDWVQVVAPMDPSRPNHAAFVRAATGGAVEVEAVVKRGCAECDALRALVDRVLAGRGGRAGEEGVSIKLMEVDVASLAKVLEAAPPPPLAAAAMAKEEEGAASSDEGGDSDEEDVGEGDGGGLEVVGVRELLAMAEEVSLKPHKPSHRAKAAAAGGNPKSHKGSGKREAAKRERAAAAALEAVPGAAGHHFVRVAFASEPRVPLAGDGEPRPFVLGTVADARRWLADPKPPTMLPHQRAAVGWMEGRVAARRPPRRTLLRWQMGSGKTYAAVRLVDALPPAPLVVVVCSNTLIEYWTTEVARHGRQRRGTATEFHVLGYTELNRVLRLAPDCLEGAVVVVDEAHNYRNLTGPMRDDLEGLQRAAHLVLLTGTPLVNDAEDVLGLACLLGLRGPRDEGKAVPTPAEFGAAVAAAAAAGELAVMQYDPRGDPALAHRFPPVERAVRRVPMTWLDALRYVLADTKNSLWGDTWVCTSVPNSYKIGSRERCNTGAKVAAVVAEVQAAAAARRLPLMLHSSFIRGGLDLAQAALAKAAPALRVERLTGDTPSEERQRIINRANKGLVDVQLISEAAREGANFNGGFHDMLLLDVLVNLSNQAQTENRIVRLDAAPALVAMEKRQGAAAGPAHPPPPADDEDDGKGSDPLPVRFVQFVSVFPTAAPTAADRAATLAEFAKYVPDFRGDVFAELRRHFADRGGRTVEEKMLADNARKQAEIDAYLAQLERAAVRFGDAAGAAGLGGGGAGRKPRPRSPRPDDSDRPAKRPRGRSRSR